MPVSSFREALDRLIEDGSLLQHSFYRRWQRGELSRQELRGYALEYYRFEREFPRFLSAVHAAIEEPKVRRPIAENLMDEELGEKPHVELWLDFAEGLGAAREITAAHSPSPESDALVATYRRLSTQSPVAGLAALYAYEKQQPSIAREKIAGLKTNYNVRDAKTLRFFEVHEQSDVWHAESEAAALETLCGDSVKSRQEAVGAAREAIAALHGFLSGVERRYAA